MAAANTKSTIVTNADATPRTMSPGYLSHARSRSQRATLEVAAADDTASVYRFFRVHSSWLVEQILLWNDAITSGDSYHCGLYQTAENGGAAVDDNCWADAVSLASARLVPLDITFEILNIDKIEKRVWEVAGLSADPNRWYDLCLTGATPGSAAGTISMLVRYNDGT